MSKHDVREGKGEGQAVSRREALKGLGGGLAAAVLLPRAGLEPDVRWKRTSRAQTSVRAGEGGVTADLPPSPARVARELHTVTALSDGRVLVVGGRQEQPLTTVEVLTPDNGALSRAASLRFPRYAHAAAALPDGRVLVIGGRCDEVLSSVEVYDPATDRWQPAASLRVPRAYHSATVLANGLVL
ncbi:MAG TPA: kelch repeat-containing protein, partial [Armatimonadota bacterium]